MKATVRGQGEAIDRRRRAWPGHGVSRSDAAARRLAWAAGNAQRLLGGEEAWIWRLRAADPPGDVDGATQRASAPREGQGAQDAGERLPRVDGPAPEGPAAWRRDGRKESGKAVRAVGGTTAQRLRAARGADVGARINAPRSERVANGPAARWAPMWGNALAGRMGRVNRRSEGEGAARRSATPEGRGGGSQGWIGATKRLGSEGHVGEAMRPSVLRKAVPAGSVATGMHLTALGALPGTTLGAASLATRAVEAAAETANGRYGVELAARGARDGPSNAAAVGAGREARSPLRRQKRTVRRAAAALRARLPQLGAGTGAAFFGERRERMTAVLPGAAARSGGGVAAMTHATAREREWGTEGAAAAYAGRPAAGEGGWMALPARLRKETPALRIPGRRLQNAQRWEPGTGRWIGLDAMRRETGEAQAKFTGGMSREWGREGNERAIVTGNHFYIEKNPGGEQWADQLGRMLLAELESSGSGAFFA